MIPAFAQATLRPQGFAEDVAALSNAGATAAELWLTKLEQYAESHHPLHGSTRGVRGCG